MRKLLCLLLCAALLMTLAMPVFAEETGSQPPQPVGEDTPPATTTAAPPAPTQCSHSWEMVSSVPATCTAAGSVSSKCGLCGGTKTETSPATGHSMGSWIHVDASSHKRSCACGETETAAHALTETVTTAASCSAAGVSSFSCPCGYSFTKEIPATGVHTYGSWTATVDAHSRTCTVCQKAESGKHAFEGSVSVAATCAEEGVWAEYCPTCEHIVYEVIPKLTTHTYDNSCDPDCNVCGIIRETEHNYQAWYSKNSTGHWYACTKCGDKGSFGKHYPGPAATEEKDQICLTCGYVMTPKLNHNHDYASTWANDESGHWYTCSGCEEKKDFGEHQFDDPCDADCNICGFMTGNAHTFDGIWHSDEDGHWFVCSVCGGVAEAREHTAPADASGEEAQYCTDCGYLIAPAMAHVHSYGEEWRNNENSHWQVCDCGEESVSEAHIWNDGVEAEDGSVTFTCTVCDAAYAEEAPELEEEDNFPWGIVLLVIVVALVGAIIALIFALKPKKRGRFS